MKKWHRKAQRIACGNALTTTCDNYNKGDIKIKKPPTRIHNDRTHRRTHQADHRLQVQRQHIGIRSSDGMVNALRLSNSQREEPWPLPHHHHRQQALRNRRALAAHRRRHNASDERKHATCAIWRTFAVLHVRHGEVHTIHDIRRAATAYQRTQIRHHAYRLLGTETARAQRAHRCHLLCRLLQARHDV